MKWFDNHRFDQDLTLVINSWNSSITDPIWKFFSNIPVWIPLYILIVALLIWKLGWKKGLVIVAGALLTFLFCDQFSNFIKETVGRLRPLRDDYMIANGLHILEHGGKFGFFSAHSANAFGLATCTVVGLKVDENFKLQGYSRFIYSWAFLVAISRIFVGKHYLGDCIVGTLVGIAAGFALGTLAKWVIRKYDI